jgi:hypothetical protein
VHDVGRLEAGSHTGHAVLFREETVGVGADDGARMGGADIAVYTQFGIGGKHLHGEGNSLVGRQYKVICHAAGSSRQDAPGNGGSSGLETDTEEDTFPGFLSQGRRPGLNRLSDVGSPARSCIRLEVEPGTAACRRRWRRWWPGRRGHSLVHIPIGVTQTGQPGPISAHLGRQNPSVLVDGHGGVPQTSMKVTGSDRPETSAAICAARPLTISRLRIRPCIS